MWRSAHRRGPDDAERRMLRRGEIKMHGFISAELLYTPREDLLACTLRAAVRCE